MRTIKLLNRVVVPKVPAFRKRLRSRAAERIATVLSDMQESSHIVVAIRRFQARVRFVQRLEGAVDGVDVCQCRCTGDAR